MEKIKKNPLAMGILSAVGVAAVLLLIDLVMSLISKEPFIDKISDTFSLVILIVGPIASGISTYIKVKNQNQEKKQN